MAILLSFKEMNRKEPEINAQNYLVTERLVIRKIRNLTTKDTEILKGSVTYPRISSIIFIIKLGANLLTSYKATSFFFGSAMQPCRIFVPPPGIESLSPAVGAQSLNHWTAREVPPQGNSLTLDESTQNVSINYNSSQIQAEKRNQFRFQLRLCSTSLNMVMCTVYVQKWDGCFLIHGYRQACFTVRFFFPLK